MAEHDEPTEPHDALSPQMLVPLTRRSHAPPERPAVPPEIAEQFHHLMQTVQVLSAHFLPETEPPPSEAVKDRTARRIKKFQRAGTEERAASASADEESGSEAPVEGDNLPASGTSRSTRWPSTNPSPGPGKLR